jgi:hypothetical protein
MLEHFYVVTLLRLGKAENSFHIKILANKLERVL